MIHKTFYFLFSILLFCNCATMLTGTSQRISIDSEPQNASVYIDGKKYGKTPLEKVKIKKSFNTVTDFGKYITLELDGYERSEYKLNATFNPVAILNFIWLPLGLVDIFTGAVVRYEREHYFYLTPEEVEATDYNKLKQLKDLFDSGAITEEEFKTEKKKILEKK